MQEWLYGDGAVFGKKGYYQQARIGKDLDFYTNVSVGKFFGYCMGYYLHTILTQNALKGKIPVVEIGSEKGDLIADIAEFFSIFYPECALDFATLEPLESLRILQQETFKRRNPNLGFHTFCDFKALKNAQYDYILFVSNELLDAFACELIWNDKMAFIHKETLELTFESASKEVLELAKTFKITKGEIPLHAFGFVESLTNCASKWLFLSFDYGSLESRNAFSLRFYQKHTTENLFLDSTTQHYNKELLKNFALMDMTYDVNFTLWQEVFSRFKGKPWFIHHQNRALVEMGLDKMCSLYIEKFGLESYAQQSNKLRTLISPGAFGERFFGFVFANF
ncbi:SAM-dependent methyltransferase [Helicobacter sp.]|uniref:SAM-dependent methyltransferase n=1 Tax=Helicobacter sp. TaxID=218 RepID=UPI0025BA4D72|nr:SAM-dependent methyltransferase [Helicobacter sp.]MCI5968351.1 SAM-dependent methyltransferase [Helicobacter sp.]MDY2584840.1 SAM-dependent methyltransferase [Helicobacter sp.]